MNCISSLTLFMIPGSDWKEKSDPADDISPFVEDALAIERRLKKGVNLINERKRYQLCCRRIQEHVLIKLNSYESEIIGEEYITFLQQIFDKCPGEGVKHRIASCFFPPETIADQINGLKSLSSENVTGSGTEIEKRVAFLEKALAANAGVIEISNYAIPGNRSVVITHHVERKILGKMVPFQDDMLSNEQIKDMSDILRGMIERALATGGEVNFSNQPHFIITEVLNDYVYQNGDGINKAFIRVVYSDGSEAEPFPLRCLPRVQHSDNIDVSYAPLRAALISMRHLEMDEHVDFAWFRNRKVSSSLSCSETDAYCTENTITALKDHKGGLNLHMYQTGLETAVIGFYRGLVKTFLERMKKHDTSLMRIVPYYYDSKHKTYNPGKQWA